MAGQVQHLICQDSLRKKKKNGKWGSSSFKVFIFFELMHAAYWAPLHWNALKKKKKEKRQKWCSILWDASELDWTSPAQTDTSAAERGDECVEECRLPTPQPKSAFHGSAARTRETVAHLLQQLMYRKLLGSSRAPLCAKVLGSNWKVHRMLPRSCWKKHNKKNQVKSPAPTSQPASAVWETKELICDTEIDMKQPAGCQHTYPTGMWFHRRRKKKKKMTMKNSQCTVVVRSECGETRGHCGSNFQAGGGGNH